MLLRLREVGQRREIQLLDRLIDKKAKMIFRESIGGCI